MTFKNLLLDQVDNVKRGVNMDNWGKIVDDDPPHDYNCQRFD